MEFAFKSVNAVMTPTSKSTGGSLFFCREATAREKGVSMHGTKLCYRRTMCTLGANRQVSFDSSRHGLFLDGNRMGVTALANFSATACAWQRDIHRPSLEGKGSRDGFADSDAVFGRDGRGRLGGDPGRQVV